MNDPNAPPLVVTGPAQAQTDTHPLVLTVPDFGEVTASGCSVTPYCSWTRA